MNVDELQSAHHAAQGPGPKQEPIIKGGKGKGKKGGKGDSPSNPPPKSSEASGKGPGKGDSLAFRRRKPRPTLGRLRWRLMHLRLECCPTCNTGLVGLFANLDLCKLVLMKGCVACGSARNDR